MVVVWWWCGGGEAGFHMVVLEYIGGNLSGSDLTIISIPTAIYSGSIV